MDKYSQKWVSKLFRQERWSITLGQTTYYSVPEDQVDIGWRLHEETHKSQWAQEGRLKFAIKYIWYAFWYGYQENPYEIEARANEPRKHLSQIW